MLSGCHLLLTIQNSISDLNFQQVYLQKAKNQLLRISTLPLRIHLCCRNRWGRHMGPVNKYFNTKFENSTWKKHNPCSERRPWMESSIQLSLTTAAVCVCVCVYMAGSKNPFGGPWLLWLPAGVQTLLPQEVWSHTSSPRACSQSLPEFVQVPLQAFGLKWSWQLWPELFDSQLCWLEGPGWLCLLFF